MNMPVMMVVDNSPAVPARPLPVDDSDPLATFQDIIARTPDTQSVEPAMLQHFHRLCSDLGIAEFVEIDDQQVLQDARQGSCSGPLVIAELLMAIGRFPLAVALGEVLFGRFPMDHRVQDALARARYYQKLGRVHERPGQELAGKVCPMLWNTVHVLPAGQVHQCCSVWLRTPVGNVFKAPLEDVWRSPEAESVRQSAVDGDYRFCGKMSCPHIQRALFDEGTPQQDFWQADVPPSAPAPTRFNLSYDLTCNLSCPSCRSQPIAAKGEELDRIEKVTNNVIELLKQGERLEVTGSGDPFSSKSFRRLLATVNPQDFPKLRITIMTNGLLMKRREWVRFEHLHGMIDAVNVSVDAATPETYRVLRRGGELEDLLPNLAFIGELRASGAISHYRLCFVAQQLNFREMPAFHALAASVGADQVHFQMLHDWGVIPSAELNHKRVHLSDHPEFHDFIGVIRALPLGSTAKPRIISDFSYLA